jgi:hypothetical protein
MSEQTPANGRDPRRVTGAVLIAVGLVLFILQMTTGITVSLMLLVGGIAFLAAYFNKKSYGLLMPGCILIGIGLGRLDDEYIGFFRDPTFVWLGIGFLAIFVIDRFHRGAAGWWPLIPGCILLFMGLEPGGMSIGELFSKGWPLALIIIGILYFTGKIGTRCDNDRGDDRAGKDGP